MKLLIVDDDPNILASLRFMLADEGFDILTASSAAEAMALTAHVNLVLADLNFKSDTTSGQEGIRLVEAIRASDADLPIITMTGWATIEIAVQALKSGAQDFIQKPWNDDQLLACIQTQLKLAEMERRTERLAQQNRHLTGQPHPGQRDGIVAESLTMKQLLDQLDQLAGSHMSILLTGDNGTGKSMLAHYIHRASGRAAESFVGVNMGAIADNLFESEMFGHVKGAFTDARDSRVGRFEMADGGTLFLDELANIPIGQQGKLLRVLESGEFERVGSSKTIRADARVVSATNADLEKMIDDGEFRQDLFYRLNTVQLHVPALRERQADIQPLAEHFLARHAARYRRPTPVLSSDAVIAMRQHSWPGNIRELSHLMERTLFTASGNRIEPDDLQMTAQTDSAVVDWSTMTFDAIEREILQSRLEHHGGNASATAESLGLSRSGYYRRVNKHGLG